MNFKSNVIINEKKYNFYDINKSGIKDINKMPYSIRILLEGILRKLDGIVVTNEHLEAIIDFSKNAQKKEIPFLPSRVILQDFTGVPAILDITAMGLAMEEKGLENTIKPTVPVDLIIDHSLQVDSFGKNDSYDLNLKKEYERNKERYEFLSHAEGNIKGVRIIPPSIGIIHQINLEYIADVVMKDKNDNETILYPDTVFGTDSHTTMINGLGVLGWGVGGIEAEAAMLSQPSYIPIPKVIGVKITGKLKEGSNATDIALRVTQRLREVGVVSCFVEFFGEGYKNLSLSDRATIANMSPEYGATCGFFPVDDETLTYLKLTNRSDEDISVIKEYLKANSMYFDEENEPTYSEVIEIDLNEITTSLAGPKRPQDRILLENMKKEFDETFKSDKEVLVTIKDIKSDSNKHKTVSIKNGSIVIAAITSCTNTSNPFVMIAAGLLAKKAVELDLLVPEYVKTSLTAGSRVVTKYLEKAGLVPYLDKLGFTNAGYGCATCIGNSGPIDESLEKAIKDNELIVASVLSGNRNFEGRIHQAVKANYLASPPLVIAYAIAGNISIDLLNEPIGISKNNKNIYLKDIWPTSKEINEVVAKVVTPALYKEVYGEMSSRKDIMWDSVKQKDKGNFIFKEESTYIRKPPFFDIKTSNDVNELKNMRVLALFSDSVTTDHISPAGNIAKESPAAKYLLENNIKVEDFNTYGSRRGNHEVMVRGTFANIRIKNEILKDTEGGYTIHWPTNEKMSIFEACELYKKDKTPLLVIAGKDYGMGSSRDWAAKGPYLLGVKVVLAESYERIHRSNLVMMGILPLQFMEGENKETLSISGEEKFSILDINENIARILVEDGKNNVKEINAQVRFDSAIEKEYYKAGGILQMVLNKRGLN